MAKIKNAVGRPSKYSKEVTSKICELIASGESLRKICENKDMPSIETIRSWLSDDTKSEFLAQYARAREEQAEYYADQIIELSDLVDETSNTAIAKAKLQIDARKWKASKLAPKRYGDKLEHSGDMSIRVETKPISSIFEADD